MDKAAIISLEVSLDYILIYIYIYTSLDGSDMLYIDILHSHTSLLYATTALVT